MTFQHVPLLGPCVYPGHINTVPTCTTSLKLVLVFICASNPLPSSLPSPLRKIHVSKFFDIKNLHHPGLSVQRSSSRLSYFFLIAYWEDVGLFVSITHPRSRKKRVHLCRASVPNRGGVPSGSRRAGISRSRLGYPVLWLLQNLLHHLLTAIVSPALLLREGKENSVENVGEVVPGESSQEPVKSSIHQQDKHSGAGNGQGRVEGLGNLYCYV